MTFTSWIFRGVLSFYVICLVVEWNQAEGRSAPYLETNEITYSVDERSIQAPICGPNAICGYLQANAKGVNQQRMCACPSGSCPMVWDPFDGQSVTQGSDQYKFCGKTGALSVCEPGHTAYTSKTIFSKRTSEKLSQLDHIQCVCPESHNYELAKQHYGDIDAESEVMDVTYICAPLPTCGTGDICKFVSETADTFLVNRKCECPSGLRCPTVSENGSSESFAMGSGLIHPIRCHH